MFLHNITCVNIEYSFWTSIHCSLNILCELTWFERFFRCENFNVIFKMFPVHRLWYVNVRWPVFIILHRYLFWQSICANYFSPKDLFHDLRQLPYVKGKMNQALGYKLNSHSNGLFQKHLILLIGVWFWWGFFVYFGFYFLAFRVFVNFSFSDLWIYKCIK